MERSGIVWFRSDLRLHDNEALSEALKLCQHILPVYIFDPKYFSHTHIYRFPRTLSHRAKFLIESVSDLRHRLRELGSDLVVRVGLPEVEIFRLAQRFGTSWVFCNRERTRDEVQSQDELEKNLWSIGQEIRFSRGKMLYYTKDLPFPISQTPDSFAAFKKAVEHFVSVRKPLPAPHDIPLQRPLNDAGLIPTPEQLGCEPLPKIKQAIHFHGGESSGIERLRQFLDVEAPKVPHLDMPKTLGQTRHSLLAPWLSHGCLSPKLIYHKMMERESSFGNDHFKKFREELLWRDFLRLMGKKYGANLFLAGGPKGEPREDLLEDWTSFEKWKNGCTGVPLVDACMRKLKHTGFLSNRARQIVASFLINDLQVSWQMGAEYFESILIDYDPCSNYGNWNYLAGVDRDVYRELTFNMVSQAKKLDPDFSYIRTWATEYQNLTNQQILSLHETVSL